MTLNFPATPDDGDRYEAPNGTTYRWNGTLGYWEVVGSSGATKVSIGETPPVALPGQLWWDSGSGEMYIYYNDADSEQWVPANSVTATGLQTGISASFLDLEARSINQQSAGKNFLMNGDFKVTQRSNGNAVTTSGFYAADRWYTELNNTPSCNITTDNAILPSSGGLSNSLKIEVPSGSPNSAATRMFIRQRMEIGDVVDLSYGSIGSKRVTVSFWIQSNISGDLTVELESHGSSWRCSQATNIAAEDATSRSWQYKTVTFPVNYNGGLLSNGSATSEGLALLIWLGAGSDVSDDVTQINSEFVSNAAGGESRVSSSNIQLTENDGSFIRISGVKLEIGDMASPFENLSTTDLLMQCRRYYQTGRHRVRQNGTGTFFNDTIQLNPPMRVAPNLTQTIIAGDGNGFADERTTDFVIRYSDPDGAEQYASDWTADSEL